MGNSGFFFGRFYVDFRKCKALNVVVTLSALVLGFGAGAADETPPDTRTCVIRTANGNYLTAAGGGGRTTDVLHTDGFRASTWETFTLVSTRDGYTGIRTKSGHYLTAVGGGGRITDVIHSDATQLRAWEKFRLLKFSHTEYAIQTINGNYLTAVGGGGRIMDVIHTDATQVASWERFSLRCRY